MPKFNRKGPEGMGSMTGGGRGFCNPANRSFFGSGTSFPAGRGRGRGFGYNRTQGLGGLSGNAYAGSAYSGRNQESQSLRSKVSALKNELESVEKRLQDLEDKEKAGN